ncbi:MAG: stage III sporulation protein AA [Clostridia bacterium]|nr:stage III sporulation protein AA [Clostridia bacterium]
METMDRLMKLLPDAAARALEAHRSVATEVRLRANRPAQLAWPEGGALVGPPIDALQLREILSALMDYSLYAHEAELAQGYFTMDDGSRVGVCGRFARTDGERLTDISSACVRVARAMPGCADALVEMIDAQVSLRSALLLSPPGMGKTTLLRDIARQLSEAGRCVGLADERHELAACRMGVPTLDVGPRTDVLDGCPRPQAIRHLIRSMAPSVIIADEIGGEGDAEALADAARCGVAIVASAHAESIEAALARPWLRGVVECGALRLAVLLGSQPGGIREIRSLDTGGDAAWRSA